MMMLEEQYFVGLGEPGTMKALHDITLKMGLDSDLPLPVVSLEGVGDLVSKTEKLPFIFVINTEESDIELVNKSIRRDVQAVLRKNEFALQVLRILSWNYIPCMQKDLL
ncbi:hypothetical protein K9L27_03815 [Candidatus Gracilibacteria bacterium]|nr:hypothetical protein [Candidatus Gracilibacteria bacterium]